MTPEELAALIESLSALTSEEREAAIAEIPVEHLEEVQGHLAAIVLEFNEAIQAGTGTREDLAAAQEARSIYDGVTARVALTVEERAEMAATAAALAEGLGEPEVEVEVDVAVSGDGNGDAGDGDADGADGADDDDEEEDSEDGDGVQASQIPAPGALNRAGRRPRQNAPKSARPAHALVASADAEGYQAGAAFADRHELADGMIRMANAVKRSRSSRKYIVASLEMEHPIELTEDPKANYEKLRDLERQASQGDDFDALTAAGGFCAPETPLYGFFDEIEEDGLWTAPTVGAPRGKVAIPLSPDFQDITVGNEDWDASTAALWTESDDIAVDSDDDTTWKTCFFVPCGTSASFQVDAAVTCLEYGNFVNKFWPEMVADTSAKTLKAHTHKVNARNIASVVAQADHTLPAIDLGDAGAIVQLLHNLEFSAQRQRDRFRMSTTARLEVLLPSWVRGALFNDAVARDSAVTFDKVLGWFDGVLSARGLNVQWLLDWQSIQEDSDYPAAVDGVMYAPGKLARLNEGRIDFGITRDTSSNRKNTFQQFMESLQGVAKIAKGITLIDNIPIYPTGGTGERVAIGAVS